MVLFNGIKNVVFKSFRDNLMFLWEYLKVSINRRSSITQEENNKTEK